MNRENSRLLNAILTTIVACLIVFAIAVSIFGTRGFYLLQTPVVVAPTLPVVPIEPTLSEPDPVIIPIEIDNTGTVDMSGAIANTGVVDCTLDYAPVCGDDKKTYSNLCRAQVANVAIAYDGECQKIVIATTGSKTPVITNTGTVVTTPKTPKIPDTTICTADVAPVCGTDNQTYSNACLAGTVAIAHIGECDGTERKVYSAESYHLYANSSLGYGFAMPKYSYYSGAGARDGAVHTMAIATTASGIVDFSGATVQIWYYKVAPAAPPSEQYRQTENGILYIKNNDTTGNAKIGKIVQTILDSVE